MLAALWPAAVYLLVLALSLVLPGRWVDGYVRDERAIARPAVRVVIAGEV